MIKNKWKIELWFQSFSYFISKINNEVTIQLLVTDDNSKAYGKAQPYETIYVSYISNQNSKSIKQYTIQCNKEGCFSVTIPKNHSFLSIDSQSQIDIDYLLQKLIDDGVDALEVLEKETMDGYFNDYIKTIVNFSVYAQEVANNIITKIQNNTCIRKKVNLELAQKNKDDATSNSSFRNLKKEILTNHQDLSEESYNDILISNFLIKYLVYKESEHLHVIKNIPPLNKANYFKTLVTEGLINERKSNSQYYDIANSIKPSNHNQHSLNQSDEINQFQQSVIGASLHLYDNNDTYFKFLRSILAKKSRKIKLSIEDVINAQKSINEFMKKVNLLSNNELYYRTSIEDTFHFSLFTAISDLIDEMISVVNKITQKASQYDILVALYSINELRKSLSELTHNHELSLKKFEAFIDGYVRNDSLQQLISETINENPKLVSQIENSLISLLDNYDINTFFKRQPYSYNPNDYRDKLTVQFISKFYEERLYNSKERSDLYY